MGYSSSRVASLIGCSYFEAAEASIAERPRTRKSTVPSLQRKESYSRVIITDYRYGHGRTLKRSQTRVGHRTLGYWILELRLSGLGITLKRLEAVPRKSFLEVRVIILNYDNFSTDHITQANLSAQVCCSPLMLAKKRANKKRIEMTNFYMSAWPDDPIIRGAVMQSSDSKLLSMCAFRHFSSWPPSQHHNRSGG